MTKNRFFLGLAPSVAMFAAGLMPFATTALAATHTATEGAFPGGKWRFHAEATCRCDDQSCKTIACDGESGVSYEDARFKAMLTLQGKARAENGRIEGTPSVTIRFEFNR